MYTTLSILHLIFSIYLVGSVTFMVLVLQPRLKRLGPAIQSPVMGLLTPIMVALNATSFIVIMATGIPMTFMARSSSLGALVTTGWGWDIIIGIIATIAAAIVGFGIIVPTGLRLGKLGASIAGRAPTPEEGQQLQGLSTKLEKLSRVNFTLIVIALATMVIARYL